MEKTEMTCIACPMGCRMLVWKNESGEVCVEQNGCKRGIAYGTQEFTRPMRQVTSLVRVCGGMHPLCSVKTQDVVPKDKIPDVLRAIREARPSAPVKVGQVIIPDIAGTGVSLVATSNCLPG